MKVGILPERGDGLHDPWGRRPGYAPDVPSIGHA